MVWLQHLLYLHSMEVSNCTYIDRQTLDPAGQKMLDRLNGTMLRRHDFSKGSKQTVPLVDLSLLYRWGDSSMSHDYGYKWTGYIDLYRFEPQKNYGYQQRFKTVKDIIHHMMRTNKGQTTSAYDQALQEITTNGAALQKWPQYCNNLEFVKIALQTDPLALRFASESLKDEYDLVIIAVRKNPFAVEFASERIKQKETDFVDQAILAIARDVLKKSSMSAADSETIKILPQSAERRQQFWEDVSIFRHLSPELKTNFDVIDEWLDACSKKFVWKNESAVHRQYMEQFLHDKIRIWYTWYTVLRMMD